MTQEDPQKAPVNDDLEHMQPMGGKPKVALLIGGTVIIIAVIALIVILTMT